MISGILTIREMGAFALSPQPISISNLMNIATTNFGSRYRRPVMLFRLYIFSP